MIYGFKELAGMLKRATELQCMLGRYLSKHNWAANVNSCCCNADISVIKAALTFSLEKNKRHGAMKRGATIGYLILCLERWIAEADLSVLERALVIEYCGITQGTIQHVTATIPAEERAGVLQLFAEKKAVNLGKPKLI